MGHNLPLDQRFLEVEFARAGKQFTVGPAISTMRFDQYADRAGRRSLRDCCRAVEVDDFEQDGVPHSALADARSTARLLQHYVHTDRLS